MPRGSAPGERRGGRQKGTPNKKTVALQVAIAKAGRSPLEFMLEVMVAPIPEDADAEQKMRILAMKLEAAKSAAPYCHSRKGSTEDDPHAKTDRAAMLRQAVREAQEKSNPAGGKK